MNNNKKYKVEMMCKVLQISKSSYYDRLNNKYTKRAEQNKFLDNVIMECYFNNKQRYGSPRITKELKSNGVKVSHNTVASRMQKMKLYSKLGRKYIHSVYSRHNYKCFDNLLNRQFEVSSPSKVWVSDITYIPTREGFIYQTIIMDLFDRKIIGWSNSETMSAEQTVIPAFNMAVKNRICKEGLICHSDRGVQYASHAFTDLLSMYKSRQSMSRKGNCWDNAVAESFFKTLKAELIYGNCLVSKNEMKKLLFEYTEIYYNKNRRHSALGLLTIEEFNRKINQKNLYVKNFA